jgi:hypothetical protein
METKVFKKGGFFAEARARYTEHMDNVNSLAIDIGYRPCLRAGFCTLFARFDWVKQASPLASIWLLKQLALKTRAVRTSVYGRAAHSKPSGIFRSN